MNFDVLIKALNTFLDLGVPVVAPSLLFVLALIFRVPLGRAVRAAVTYGIGFVGIFLVLTMMLTALSGAAQKMIEHTGLQLQIIDVGWPVLAAVAFGVPTFPTVFLGILLINLLMFALKWTKTLDIDFHNYYHWVLPATVVYFATKNVWAGTVVGLVNGVITLKLADWTEKHIDEWWELPGISIPHMSTIGWYPFCYLMDWVIDRIPGLNKIRLDTEKMQEKLGVLGEPMLIGAIIGLALGIGAQMALKDILNLAMNLGAAMILMPRMISLLMEGLVPIFQAARKWVLERFPGYDFRVGLDAAVLVGKPEVLVNGMLMVPVMIGLMFVLPGNKVLPFADLSVLSFFCMWAVGVNRGNLFRGLIIGTVICAFILWGAGIVAPTLTAMGQASGFDAGTAQMYTCLECGSITFSQGINAIIYALLSLNAWLIAAISVVLGAVALFVFRLIMRLPRQANDLDEKEKAELYPNGVNSALP